MNVTTLALPPPRCLLSVRATRPAAELHQELLATFVSEEDDEQSLARHRLIGSPEPWVSTRDELEVWSLQCPCGETKGKLFGVRIEDQFCAPVRFACTKCTFTSKIFDNTTDGWTGETSRHQRRSRKEPNMTFAMFCRGCKGTVWFPAVIVTYQGDLGGIPKERIQDHFDVILIGGTCTSCGKIALGYTEECA